MAGPAAPAVAAPAAAQQLTLAMLGTAVTFLYTGARQHLQSPLPAVWHDIQWVTGKIFSASTAIGTVKGAVTTIVTTTGYFGVRRQVCKYDIPYVCTAVSAPFDLAKGTLSYAAQALGSAAAEITASTAAAASKGAGGALVKKGAEELKEAPTSLMGFAEEVRKMVVPKDHEDPAKYLVDGVVSAAQGAWEGVKKPFETPEKRLQTSKSTTTAVSGAANSIFDTIKAPVLGAAPAAQATGKALIPLSLAGVSGALFYQGRKKGLETKEGRALVAGGAAGTIATLAATDALYDVGMGRGLVSTVGAVASGIGAASSAIWSHAVVPVAVGITKASLPVALAATSGTLLYQGYEKGPETKEGKKLVAKGAAAAIATLATTDAIYRVGLCRGLVTTVGTVASGIGTVSSAIWSYGIVPAANGIAVAAVPTALLGGAGTLLYRSWKEGGLDTQKGRALAAFGIVSGLMGGFAAYHAVTA